jgi:hypothetical protein
MIAAPPLNTHIPNTPYSTPSHPAHLHSGTLLIHRHTYFSPLFPTHLHPAGKGCGVSLEQLSTPLTQRHNTQWFYRAICLRRRIVCEAGGSQGEQCAGCVRARREGVGAAVREAHTTAVRREARTIPNIYTCGVPAKYKSGHLLVVRALVSALLGDNTTCNKHHETQSARLQDANTPSFVQASTTYTPLKPSYLRLR